MSPTTHCRPRARPYPRSRITLGLVALSLLPACAGIFQRARPPVPEEFFRHGVGQLSVGVAEADISPPVGGYLGGFDLARLSTAEHSALKVRAMVLIVGDLKVAVVGIDNLGLQREDVDWIKTRIYGFANGNVFLCSSHTHAGPDLIGLWGYYLLTSGRDRGYLALVRERIGQAVSAAEAAARPARLLRAEVRVPNDGLIKNSNRRGVFDPRFTVLQAVPLEAGPPIGAILHLACHPEVLRRRNTLISSDFVGDLCDRWVTAGLGQPVFVNGALGAMISPVPRGVDGIEAMGQGLFELARTGLATATPVVTGDMELRRRDVYMPMGAGVLALARQFGVIPREVYDGALRATVGYLRIGDLELCTVPGEIEPGLAERVRRATRRPRMLVFGLVDDEVGYLLSEADAHDPEFAYERGMSPGPRSGELVFEALVGDR